MKHPAFFDSRRPQSPHARCALDACQVRIGCASDAHRVRVRRARDPRRTGGGCAAARRWACAIEALDGLASMESRSSARWLDEAFVPPPQLGMRRRRDGLGAPMPCRRKCGETV